MPPLSSFLRAARSPAPETSGPPSAGEKETVTAALAGDEDAFEAMVRLYSRRVYVIAYGITQDVAEAEDLVQETFLKAHQQRGRLREADKLLPWLDTVARNGARDRLRKRRPQAPAETFDTLVDPQAERPGSALERDERTERLRRALGALPEEHRTALTLLYLEGFDYRAIQARMGLSNGALRGILGRALGTLRRNAGLNALERKNS